MSKYIVEVAKEEEEASFSYPYFDFLSSMPLDEKTLQPIQLLAEKGVKWWKYRAIDYLLEKEKSIEKEWLIPLFKDSIV